MSRSSEEATTLLAGTRIRTLRVAGVTHRRSADSISARRVPSSPRGTSSPVALIRRVLLRALVVVQSCLIVGCSGGANEPEERYVETLVTTREAFCECRDRAGLDPPPPESCEAPPDSQVKCLFEGDMVVGHDEWVDLLECWTARNVGRTECLRDGPCKERCLLTALYSPESDWEPPDACDRVTDAARDHANECLSK